MEKENKIIPGKKVTLPPTPDSAIKKISLGEVIQRMDKREQVDVLDAIGGALAEILEEGEECPTCSLEGNVIEGLESITEDETMCEEYLAARRCEQWIDEEAFVRWNKGKQLALSNFIGARLGKLILKDISQAASQRNNSTDPRFRQKGKGKTGYLTPTPNHRHRIHRGRRS